MAATALILASLSAVQSANSSQPLVLSSNAHTEKILAATTSARTISLSGTGTVTTVPDLAQVSLGVFTTATAAEEAAVENANRMQKVVSALQSLGFQNRDIRTEFLNVQPIFEFDERRRTQNIVGFSATNNVRVTTAERDTVSAIIDSALAAGANQVNSLQFTLSETKQKELQDEAITRAVEDANTKADKIAELMRVRITGVQSVSVGGGIPPIGLQFAVAEARPATPVFAGETLVTFTVSVIYTIE